ncbi:MAG: YhcH/YjgK/YiaL family protein [Acidaminococcaceae bacterium]|nr:YhcH/YjgK/YiaL family protein [Acidaminococcaceae bacterium]
MLCGNKQDIEKILPYVSEGLQKAQYIRETNFAELANGEYEIDGRNVFVRVNTYLTEPKTDKKPEAHNQYIDVQYLGAGEEIIYFAPRRAEHIIVEDHAEESDLLFYEELDEKDVSFCRRGISQCFSLGITSARLQYKEGSTSSAENSC